MGAAVTNLDGNDLPIPSQDEFYQHVTEALDALGGEEGWFEASDDDAGLEEIANWIRDNRGYVPRADWIRTLFFEAHQPKDDPHHNSHSSSTFTTGSSSSSSSGGGGGGGGGGVKQTVDNQQARLKVSLKQDSLERVPSCQHTVSQVELTNTVSDLI